MSDKQQYMFVQAPAEDQWWLYIALAVLCFIVLVMLPKKVATQQPPSTYQKPGNPFPGRTPSPVKPPGYEYGITEPVVDPIPPQPYEPVDPPLVKGPMKPSPDHPNYGKPITGGPLIKEPPKMMTTTDPNKPTPQEKAMLDEMKRLFEKNMMVFDLFVAASEGRPVKGMNISFMYLHVFKKYGKTYFAHLYTKGVAVGGNTTMPIKIPGIGYMTNSPYEEEDPDDSYVSSQYRPENRYNRGTTESMFSTVDLISETQFVEDVNVVSLSNESYDQNWM